MIEDLLVVVIPILIIKIIGNTGYSEAPNAHSVHRLLTVPVVAKIS